MAAAEFKTTAWLNALLVECIWFYLHRLPRFEQSLCSKTPTKRKSKRKLVYKSSQVVSKIVDNLYISSKKNTYLGSCQFSCPSDSSALDGRPLMYKLVGSIVWGSTGLNPFTRDTSSEFFLVPKEDKRIQPKTTPNARQVCKHYRKVLTRYGLTHGNHELRTSSQQSLQKQAYQAEKSEHVRERFIDVRISASCTWLHL